MSASTDTLSPCRLDKETLNCKGNKLLDLVSYAYNLPTVSVKGQEHLISGTFTLKAGASGKSQDEVRKLLQPVLLDRFALKLTQSQTYTIVVADKSKLKPSPGKAKAVRKINQEDKSLTCTHASLPQLADFISTNSTDIFRKPLISGPNEGDFDFNISWPPGNKESLVQSLKAAGLDLTSTLESISIESSANPPQPIQLRGTFIAQSERTGIAHALLSVHILLAMLFIWGSRKDNKHLRQLGNRMEASAANVRSMVSLLSSEINQLQKKLTNLPWSPPKRTEPENRRATANQPSKGKTEPNLGKRQDPQKNSGRNPPEKWNPPIPAETNLTALYRRARSGSHGRAEFEAACRSTSRITCQNLDDLNLNPDATLRFGTHPQGTLLAAEDNSGTWLFPFYGLDFDNDKLGRLFRYPENAGSQLLLRKPGVLERTGEEWIMRQPGEFSNG